MSEKIVQRCDRVVFLIGSGNTDCIFGGKVHNSFFKSFSLDFEEEPSYIGHSLQTHYLSAPES